MTVGIPGTYWVTKTYPDPFGRAVRALDATVEFAVERSAPVSAILYDLLGRAVQTIYEETPSAGMPVQARVDARGLASGTYVLVVTGHTFRDSQRVTIAR